MCVQQEEHAGEQMLLEAPPTAMVQSQASAMLFGMAYRSAADPDSRGFREGSSVVA